MPFVEPAQAKVLWHPPGLVGDARPPNHLYFGDNLPVLAALLDDPDVRGQVRLVYIDPPFSTRMVYQSRALADAYSDLLCGGSYVEFLRERLILLRELLANDGSIYVHLDGNMVFHIKVIMDEVFGSSNFRNCITRKKCNPKNYTRRAYGNVCDFILFYSKSDSYVWNRPREQWTLERAEKEYTYVEQATGRRYKKVPVHAPGVRNGETGRTWRGMAPPPGKHWQYTPSTLDEMDRRGEVYWSPTGNPRRKIYLDESDGVQIQDLWLDCRDAHNQNIRVTGYPTEKNLQVLHRITKASSNPGDLVIDCFEGAGTTLVAASQLQRRWIGIDSSPQAIATTLRRFAVGDFVSCRADSDAKPPRAALALFDEHPSETPGPSQPWNPITDFVLLSSAPPSPDVEMAVSRWLPCEQPEPVVRDGGAPSRENDTMAAVHERAAVREAKPSPKGTGQMNTRPRGGHGKKSRRRRA
jgi:adenine-specific DNA-methyltransferase